MASTVNAAFAQFMAARVNLDEADTEGARTSRDWLVDQIDAIPSRNSKFPELYPDIHIHYGSFARRTKIRELDDVDMMIGLKGLGTTYGESGGQVQLTVPDGIALMDLCHEGNILLNSRKVINAFVNALSSIPQYSNSKLGRNGSAAVLNLTSYPWSFDIVPAFMTSPEWDNRTYYIIPDGDGHWMKTDPRIDKERVSRTNKDHDGYALRPIRIMKYWNRRATMPTASSYMLEALVLDYYENSLTKASAYVDVEMVNLLAHLASAVLGAVQDPKRIQGDLNTLSWDERMAISSRASADYSKARAARQYEDAGNHAAAIGKWIEVLGPDFPRFG